MAKKIYIMCARVRCACAALRRALCSRQLLTRACACGAVLAPLSYYSMYGHVYALAQKARVAATQRGCRHTLRTRVWRRALTCPPLRPRAPAPRRSRRAWTPWTAWRACSTRSPRRCLLRRACAVEPRLPFLEHHGTRALPASPAAELRPATGAGQDARAAQAGRAHHHRRGAPGGAPTDHGSMAACVACSRAAGLPLTRVHRRGAGGRLPVRHGHAVRSCAGGGAHAAPQRLPLHWGAALTATPRASQLRHDVRSAEVLLRQARARHALLVWPCASSLLARQR